MDLSWVRSAHLIGVMAWSTSLVASSCLVLWRPSSSSSKEMGETLLRLYRRISLPGMGLALFTGIWMLHSTSGLVRLPFMIAKLALVGLLIAADHLAMQSAKRMANERYVPPLFSIVHALAGVWVALVIVLIVTKPGL